MGTAHPGVGGGGWPGATIHRGRQGTADRIPAGRRAGVSRFAGTQQSMKVSYFCGIMAGALLLYLLSTGPVARAVGWNPTPQIGKRIEILYFPVIWLAANCEEF